MLAVSLLLAFLPVRVAAHGGTEISVRGSVRVDGPIEITGEEFAANDTVLIVLRRAGTEAVELGRVPVGATGEFQALLHVPASMRAGLYELAAEGKESATAEVTILESAAGTQPGGAASEAEGDVSNDRAASEVIGLALVTAATALAGIGVLWRFRPHPRRARV